MRIISDDDVRRRLNIDDSIHVIEKSLLEYSKGAAKNLPRSTIETPQGTFRVMSAFVPGMGVVGSKQGFWASEYKGEKTSAMSSEIVSLYDIRSGSILALVNSHYLNQVRTGAVGGISVKYMSNDDSTKAGVIGAGLHARTQVLGALAVRDVRKIKVYSRNHANRQRFCEAVGNEIGIDLTPVDSAEDAIRGSDIVLEATTSKSPVINGKYLSEGCHVTSISGGYLGARQMDDETIRTAAIVAVDSKQQVLIDGTGDILQPIENGIISLKKIVEIADVVSRKAIGRRSNKDRTVFKSCGMALFDVSVAKRVLDIIS